MPPYAKFITSSLMSLALGILIIALPVRLLISQAFLEIAYSLPWVQADVYGFSTQQRVELASDAIHFLLHRYEDVWLSQRSIDADAMPSQSCMPVANVQEQCHLYNEREVSHMTDVQQVIQHLFALVLPSCSIILLGCFVVAWRDEWNILPISLRFTNLLILALILACVFSATVAWDSFFTAFHSLFFEGDSWLFYYWDTLIRLFPEPFWYTATITLSLLIILELVAIQLFAHVLWRFLKAKEYRL